MKLHYSDICSIARDDTAKAFSWEGKRGIFLFLILTSVLIVIVVPTGVSRDSADYWVKAVNFKIETVNDAERRPGTEKNCTAEADESSRH